MDSLILSTIPGLLFVIPQIIIIVACIKYLKHRKTASGILIFIGAIIGLLGSIFHSTVIPILVHFDIIDYNIGGINIFTITTPISFIGSLLFAIGLFQLIQEKLRIEQTSN